MSDTNDSNTTDGVTVTTPHPAADAVLTPEAVAFVAGLHRKFGPRRAELLAARAERQARFDGGERPDFLSDTAEIRTLEWQVPEAPKALADRRVEITGPTDRKMMINALNSGARVFMADFEDANSPTWDNMLTGQANLMEAVRGTIAITGGDKEYRLGDDPATLVIRPRGWHLPERHLTVDGEPVSASLFDFGLYVFHNGRESLERGAGPYYYIAKLESHLEARLWNDVMTAAEEELGLETGRSGPPFSSRPSPPPSKWTRSSTSCGTTSPASTPAGGTTSSRWPSGSPRTRRSCCPTGPWSP